MIVRGRSEEGNVMQVGSFASSKEDAGTQAFFTQKKKKKTKEATSL